MQTLRIPDKPGPSRDLYRTVCELVVAHTDAYPGLRDMHDGTALPGTPPEVLSFSDWTAVLSAARAAIEQSAYIDDKDVRYIWPRVRDHLNHCGRAHRFFRHRDSAVPPADDAQPRLPPSEAEDVLVGDARLDGRPTAPHRRCARRPSSHGNKVGIILMSAFEL